MMRKILLSITILLILGSFTSAEMIWDRTFGGSADDYAYDMKQTSDGGFIIAGSTASYGAGGNDIWLIKTNSEGIMQWNKTFGGSGDDCARAVCQTSDGGFVVAGYTSSYGAGSYDVFLFKTDSSGNWLWSQTFGGSSDDYGTSMQQTTDGGLIIAGYTASYGAGGYDFWLIKTNASGILQWSRTYGLGANDRARCVQQTSDGGYIITGDTRSYGAQIDDVLLVKTDSIGIEEWHQLFGGYYNDRGNSVVQLDDGGYYVTGFKGTSEGNDLWLIRTDSSGNDLWDEAYGGSGNDGGSSIQQSSDGSYLVSGWTGSYGSGGTDFWLLKINAWGYKEYEEFYGGVNDEFCYTAIQNADNDFVMIGNTVSDGSGDSEIWMVKSSPDYNCWMKIYGGYYDEVGYSVDQTSDGEFVLTGYTRSSSYGDEDLWLIKTDAVGNMIWNKTFGGDYEDIGYSIQQTSDGGYIVAGCSGSYNTNNHLNDVWLIKTDLAGNLQWHKTYGGVKPQDWPDIGYSVQQTSDNGYIITGETWSYGEGSSDVWLIKTDTVGNKLWDKTFGGSEFDCGYSVKQTNDGGYIITGLNNSYSSGNPNIWLIKTGPLGWKQWDYIFGSYYGYSVLQTSDGGYVITGTTISYIPGDEDIILIKTDDAGNKLWDKTFGGINNDMGLSIQQTDDGGFIIAGYTNSYGAGEYDAWLIKTDAGGNLQWDKTFGGPHEDYGCYVQQCSDGGYIVTGYTNSFDSNYYDILLIYYNPGEPAPPPTTPLFPKEIALLLIFTILIFATIIFLRKRKKI